MIKYILKLNKTLIACLTLLSLLLLNSCNENVIVEDNSVSYLSFTSIATESQVGYKSKEKIDTSEIFYSKDKKNWIQWDGTFVKLVENEKIYVKNMKTILSTINYNFKFVMTGRIDVSGDISSMINFGEMTDDCYSMLFASCESLINAKDLLLPATTLSSHCYFMMFYNCVNLKTTPTLPATELADGCYHSMFDKCLSLTNAPELPATELKPFCYSQMFSECRSLICAPELPAEEMRDSCYSNMFAYCDSIKSMPNLPATSLADSCYSLMFAGCDNLLKTTELPSMNLVENCYSYMFYKCSKLEEISLQYSGEFTDEYFYNWVDSIAEKGKIHYSGFDTKRGPSAIPNGFDIIVEDECLNFKSLLENSYISYVVDGKVDTSGIMYSADKVDWKKWNGDKIKLDTNDVIHIKNTNSKLSSKNSTFSFCLSGKFAISGNLRSMLNNENVKEYCYRRLFFNCDGLVYANDLEMPSLKLSKKCYSEMFLDCDNLIIAPKLFAKKLSDYCYEGMFKNCYSLVECPVLPAIKLSKYCYTSMFENCTTITTVHMLPADILVDGCYKKMYSGCKNLNYVKLSYDKSFSKKFFENWLKDVSQTGNLYYGGRDYTKGSSAIPKDWNVAEPFAIQALSEGVSASYITNGLVDTSKIYYSKDRVKWTKWNGTKIKIKNKEKLYVKNENFTLSFNLSNYIQFKITGSVELSGDISALINYGLVDKMSRYIQLFKECESIVEAKDLVLSSLNLCGADYRGMFYKCKNLKSAPQIKAKKLASGCFYTMFFECENLETAPDLLAEELEDACYSWMFAGCNNLKKLKIAYEGDFNKNYTHEWLYGVSSNGELYYNGNDSQRGPTAIPEGWNIIKYDKNSENQ